MWHSAYFTTICKSTSYFQLHLKNYFSSKFPNQFIAYVLGSFAKNWFFPSLINGWRELDFLSLHWPYTKTEMGSSMSSFWVSYTLMGNQWINFIYLETLLLSHYVLLFEIMPKRKNLSFHFFDLLAAPPLQNLQATILSRNSLWELRWVSCRSRTWMFLEFSQIKAKVIPFHFL